MGDVAKIAAGLTERQRQFICNDAFVSNRNSRWQLQSACAGKGLMTGDRLNPLGEQVRAHLLAPPTDEQTEGRG